MKEVRVGTEQGEVMADAQLRDQRINRAHLDAVASAKIAQFSSLDMVEPVRGDEGKCRKVLQQAGAGVCANETLQDFLQYQTSANDRLALLQGRTQGPQLWPSVRGVASKG